MLEIRKYPDPVLRKKCEKIREITPEIRQLASDMLKAMYGNDGCGLAAPQVGISKRLIVVDIGEGPLVLANPEITWKSREKSFSEEGCLSLPGVLVRVRRAKEAEVSGIRPRDGQAVTVKAFGLFAIAIQHEIDHLDGILIIDKVGPIGKWALKRQLRAGKAAL